MSLSIEAVKNTVSLQGRIEDIMNYQKQYEKLKEIEKVVLKSDLRDIDTTDGGGVYATSTGGQVTGFGAGDVESDGEEDDLLELLKEIESINI